MDRRDFLALTAFAALAAAVQACGGDDASPGSTVPVGGEPVGVARSDLQRIAADPAAAAVAAAAINAFGADLHARLVADRPDENLVFSPASILLALTMARAGAAGETASEMDAVLHVDDADAFYPAVNALSAALDALNGEVQDAAGETVELVLRIANALWGQSGLAFEQPFLDLLATEFGAGLELVDFMADPEAARTAINAWVAEQTEDRIEELLAQGTITPDTRLTLVNAVYLKAPWQLTFERSATDDQPFTLPDGSTVQVPTMFDERYVSHRVAGGGAVVELPYAGDRLAMVLVLPEPDADPTTVVIPSLEGLDSAKVRLSVPRWDTESSLSLAEVLGALGMPTAFTDAADFSGMTTQEQFVIGAVIHQANITVDEDGTEAAAATAVIMEATSAPVDEPISIVFDRPFLFAVRDRETGAVLFQGRVTDPSATR